MIAKDLQVIGVGGGQTSLVDARPARALTERPSTGTTWTGLPASDAFFPFPDGPQLALTRA